MFERLIVARKKYGPFILYIFDPEIREVTAALPLVVINI